MRYCGAAATEQHGVRGHTALVNDFAEKVYERQSFGARSTQRDEQQPDSRVMTILLKLFIETKG